MRKIASLFMLLTLTLVLISCGPRVSVKGYFLDVEERTTSVTFSFEIEDPKEEITGNIIAEIVDKETNMLVNSRTLYQESDYNDIVFSGLANPGSYRIDIRVMVGRESIVIVSHDVELLSLEAQTIHTVEEFMNMANNPEGNYELGQNLDFSNVDFVSPFGSVSKTFYGTFDGKGYTISNITFSSITGNLGVFGYISTGTVKNLNISNVKMGTSSNRLVTQYASKIGVLAGSVSNPLAKIENISIDQAEIYVTSNSTYQLFVGGVFGDLRSVAKNISQSNINIDVLSTSYAKVNIGGISGFVGEEGGLRQIYSQNTNIYHELKGDYIDISSKAWNINVGGVVGDFNSRLSRGLQDVIHQGTIEVNLDFGTLSGQKGTYDVYLGGLTGRSYGQIYQALYEGSITLHHTESEFESDVIKSFYVGGVTGHYESNFVIDHALYLSNSQSINLNVSEDSKVYLSYTIGVNPISLNHVVAYSGNGSLMKNLSAYEELKPSTYVTSIDGYFTSEFMTNNLN